MPTNEDRAVWAETALTAFIMASNGEDDETAITDLLANLMHMCKQRGIDSFDRLLLNAELHYAEESGN